MYFFNIIYAAIITILTLVDKENNCNKGNTYWYPLPSAPNIDPSPVCVLKCCYLPVTGEIYSTNEMNKLAA